MRALLILLSLSFLAQTTWSEDLLCSDLFSKTYAVNEFVISISGKKQSEIFLLQAHNNLTSNFDRATLRQILKTIKKSGLTDLTEEQKEFIIKFRQNTSFLRSIFQTSDEQHESPKQFADFVRDFGVLKDLLLMEDSFSAKHQAKKILHKYSDLDFDELLQDSTPASKKSVKKYFKSILENTEKIMNLETITVDQVHEVRKNLRDVLRYMQIQNEVANAVDSPQILFLKKINSKLGEICDENAALILKGEVTEDTAFDFPVKIRPRVEYFLKNYKITVED